MAYHTRGVRFGGHQSFTAGAPMTDDDLRKVAPSIFAAEAHESRSHRFAYIPTIDVLNGLREAGFVPVRAIQGRSKIEGKADYTKHMIRLRHPDHQGRNGTEPEAVLINAHDGTASYQCMSGIFRFICTNSMIVMENGATDIRVAHKGDIVDKVIEGTFTVIEEAQLTLDKAEAWSGIALSSDERQLMAESAHVLRFSDAEGHVHTPIQPTQLLTPRRQEDTVNNLWGVHNVIQENMIKGGLHARNSQGRRVTTKTIHAIDGDVRLNRALWALSAGMAALKGVV